METSVQARAAGTTGCQLQQRAAELGLCAAGICICLETEPSSKQRVHGRKHFVFYTTADKGPGQSTQS